MAKTIEVPEIVTVRDLAERMETSPIDIIKELMKSGIMANINQEIDFDTAAIVAEEMGYDPIPYIEETDDDDGVELPEWRNVLARERDKDLVERPAVVTMLGHVDHGKTSLLDVIRKANVVDGEAGGITQHIGAYQIQHEGKAITFLDTPGHAAFTAMRARGARATDIAILVVAADDGLMPQTREAIDHAKAAKVAIIVALNKIDLATANPDRALSQLAEVDLTPDSWGGDTLVIPVSAITKEGIDDLIEAILLTSEELEPRANPKARAATGTVIEARMERGRGSVATVLVQNGTLSKGDTLLIDRHYGRIKAMYDFNGKDVKSAEPSVPVSVSGLNGMPEAGDQFRVVKSEKEARKLVDEIGEAQEERVAGPSLEDFFSRMQSGETKKLSLIVKADVQGSLEPIVNSLEKIDVPSDDVELDILRSATGRISESDVMLASASEAIVLGFNVDTDSAAKVAAASEGVEIKNYSIIYKMFEDVENSLNGMMEPVYEMQIIGRAEVRALFRIRGVGNIAGCFMRLGNAERNATARVIRDSKLLHEGKVSSLKHLQENVTEVKQGFEFGVSVDGFTKFREGDLIEFLIEKRVA